MNASKFYTYAELNMINKLVQHFGIGTVKAPLAGSAFTLCLTKRCWNCNQYFDSWWKCSFTNREEFFQSYPKSMRSIDLSSEQFLFLRGNIKDLNFRSKKLNVQHFRAHFRQLFTKCNSKLQSFHRQRGHCSYHANSRLKLASALHMQTFARTIANICHRHGMLFWMRWPPNVCTPPPSHENAILSWHGDFCLKNLRDLCLAMQPTKPRN